MPRLVSWLFVPGAAQRFMEKLRVAKPDVAVLDLEDGLTQAERPEARKRVALALSRSTSVTTPVAVRTNAVGTSDFTADLDALGPALFALVLPKVASGAEVEEVGEALSRLGLGHALVVPLIESAAGLRNAFEILTAHPSVGGVAVGGEDLAADLGLPFEVPGEPSDSARRAVMDAANARVILAAAGAGVSLRIDTPTIQLGDSELVRAASARARAGGFTAKFAVHPGQIEPLHSGFRPNELEVERAEAIIAAGAAGGANRVNGMMVDEAVMRRARQVLSDAER